MAHKRIARKLSAVPEVEAVELAGSQMSRFADEQSYVDLYVYTRGTIPLSMRAEVPGDARRAEIGNSFGDLGDELIDGEPGIRQTVNQWGLWSERAEPVALPPKLGRADDSS